MADIYGDVAGFKQYWAARGGGTAQVMAADDDDIGFALLTASEWIDQSFINQFGGLKAGQRAQVREWPRTSCYDIYGYALPNGEIPREILQATYEAAAKQITTPGIFYKDYSASKYKSVSISNAVAVEYAVGSAFDFQTQMPAIGAILYPILTGQGMTALSSLSGGVSRV